MNPVAAFLLYAAWMGPGDVPRPTMVAMYESRADCRDAASVFVTEARRAGVTYKAWCVPVPNRAAIIGPGVSDNR